MSKGKFYFSKSLEKGLKILSLFDRETPVLTQSEIAQQTEIPLGTVKTRTLLAMKKLREALREEIEELL